MSSFADKTAEAAGIITKFPGPTEKESRYLAPSKSDLHTAQHAHSITNQLIKMHNLRNRKFEEPEKYLKITGNCESRVRYVQHDKNLYVKKMLTRADNEIIAKKSPLSGTTEYIDRYNPIVKLKKAQEDATPPFTINPAPDLLGASDYRPYDQGVIRKEDQKGFRKTQYQYAHKWPEAAEIDKFPWVK